MKHIRFTQELKISALHHLENSDLSAAENEHLYGICFRKHGHDYKLQIEIEAPVSEKTGLAVDRDLFENLLKKYLIDKFDASFLNQHFDCTSGEALSFYFYQLLKPVLETELKDTKLLAVHIQETRKNWFSYSNL